MYTITSTLPCAPASVSKHVLLTPHTPPPSRAHAPPPTCCAPSRCHRNGATPHPLPAPTRPPRGSSSDSPSQPAGNDPPCRNSAIPLIPRSRKSWFRQRSPKNPGHTRPIGASWPALTNCAFDCNICSIPFTPCSLAPIESAAGIFGSQTGRLQRHIPPSHVVPYSVFTFPVLPEGMIYTPCQKRFSLAYIRAVAAHAGSFVDEPRIDCSSIDGVVRADFGRGPRIEFQAKATSQDIMRENHLAFPLPIGKYTDLSQDAMIPRILIVVLMPQERAQWLSQTSSELCLRHCAYWLPLKGQPPLPNTTRFR